MTLKPPFPSRLVPTLALALAGLYAGTALAHGDHRMVLPQDLKWAAVPSLPPGAQIAVIEGNMSQPGPFVVRLKFPANYQIPAHSHPQVERVTVISGTFHMGVGDQLDKAKSVALPPAGVMILPAQMNHFAWNEGEVVIQLNGTGPWGVTYVNPADDPRRK